MTPKLKFVEGEKVLCFHGPLIYEAKALKSTVTKEKQVRYYIHYAGWNKNWDEWVPENRVLKYNEANVQRQKEVFKQHSSAAGRSKKGTPKGKKGEMGGGGTPKDGGISSGGSESRASTPSKELNTTPLAAPAAGGRSSNRSKQLSTSSSGTPVPKEIEQAAAKKDDTKEETLPKDDASKEELQRKKRIGSSSSTSDKSVSGAGSVVGTTATVAPSTSTLSNSAASTYATNNTINRVDSTCVESEEGFFTKIEVKIKIPDELKQCLADDWDAITRQQRLLQLPAKITVQDIVDQYTAQKKAVKSTNTTKELNITDVLNGVIEYFNVMLGSQLLYKFERPQYAEILQRHPNTPISKLYGGFHLLRLFTKLGSMLGFSALDEKSMQVVLAHLNDFIKFLVKNSATYFSMSSFGSASPEYHRSTQ